MGEHEWRAAVERTLVEWEDGWRVRLPLPFQLKWIHAYLIREQEGYTVIDCGLNDGKAWETWQAVFAHLEIEPVSIQRIILTHYHPDHYGLAGRLQQLTGADVWMSTLTQEYADMFWGDESEHLDQIVHYFRRHGLPDDSVVKLEEHLQQFRRWVSPRPQPRFLDGIDTLRLGSRSYEVWRTPGHAEGHLSFYDPERKWLIGGDVLLRKITPNISLYPDGDPNPLHTYFSTLRRLQNHDIQKVWPAHGPVFDDAHFRLQELFDHHEERLEAMAQLVDGSRTAYEICTDVFGRDLSVHHLRFALAETLAHLEYLHQEGHLELVQNETTALYRPA